MLNKRVLVVTCLLLYDTVGLCDFFYYIYIYAKTNKQCTSYHLPFPIFFIIWHVISMYVHLLNNTRRLYSHSFKENIQIRVSETEKISISLWIARNVYFVLGISSNCLWSDRHMSQHVTVLSDKYIYIYIAVIRIYRADTHNNCFK